MRGLLSSVVRALAAQTRGPGFDSQQLLLFFLLPHKIIEFAFVWVEELVGFRDTSMDTHKQFTDSLSESTPIHKHKYDRINSMPHGQSLCLCFNITNYDVIGRH